MSGKIPAKILVLIFLAIGSVHDVKSRELPGSFLFIFAVFAVLCNLLLCYQKVSGIFSGILLGGSFLVFGWLTKEAIGYGDGIGITIMGILLGGNLTVIILATAFFLSALYGIGKLLLKKGTASDRMPFYPFLFMAALGGIFL